MSAQHSQEIAGHDEMVGQYESYQSFTMPHLYRVVNVRQFKVI